MTSASNASGVEHSVPHVQSRKLLSSNSAAAPRKRRKRTVVSGAPNDCFTCSNRGTPCDRRRPYCSQCLDHGRECSGYKTTLTWGIGVASRGKLRGKSLPVTGAQSASRGQENSSGVKASRPELSSAHPPTTSTVQDEKSFESRSVQQPSPNSDTTRSVNMAWMTPTMPRVPEIWPATPNSYSPKSSQFDSGESRALNNSMGNGQFNVAGPWAASYLPPAMAPMQCQKSQVQETKHNDCPPLWAPCPSPSYSQLLLAKSVGRTPRLRYLISYYAEVIAPMIVAFDGPSNPFRTHILRMAQDSESLQEAIATLSTSNLRQRQERKTLSTGRTPASRLSGMAHYALIQEDIGELSTAEIVLEEQQHRGRAVKALNAALADPQQRLADSVLGTLLILCLFHACDTGVVQFRMQFAGVTKLLALRMRISGRMSDDLKWFIRVFTWFDTMTATTNDRESYLRGTCLDIISLSDGDWDLEDLAGCDASLFRLVAQLGRLNLLSLHQTPQGHAPPDMHAPTAALPPSMIYPSQGPFVMAHGPPMVGIYGNPIATTPPQQPLPDSNAQSTSPAFWTEWFSLRQKLEAWRYTPRPNGSRPTSMPPAPPPCYISPPSSPLSQFTLPPNHHKEIYHVSESFRHASILYIERLAYPTVPSPHPRIQNLVRITMHHITAVQSDAYLLWPLFITGSECVLESDRNMIRQRCGDISRDSGFRNNLSCLDLLEKIWCLNASVSMDGFGNWTSSAAAPAGAFEKGFRWQKVMRDKRSDGEYMVV